MGGVASSYSTQPPTVACEFHLCIAYSHDTRVQCTCKERPKDHAHDPPDETIVKRHSTLPVVQNNAVEHEHTVEHVRDALGGTHDHLVHGIGSSVRAKRVSAHRRSKSLGTQKTDGLVGAENHRFHIQVQNEDYVQFVNQNRSICTGLFEVQ